MGVNTTPALYKALTFDGQTSRDYGVFITGDAVYNAPERDVEMIDIPGRNGSFALDQGRFENITVTYPAGIYADNEEDFADAVSDFRNFLCSRSGYCRLEDDYNPDEYRLAIYKNGLDVSPAQLRAGEFNISFECKPQRFLTSGETPESINDGETITNPTPFASSPLLEVGGLGEINLGDNTITILNVLIGEVIIAPGGSFLNGKNSPQSTTFTIDDSLLNVGDSISINKVEVGTSWSLTSIAPNPAGGIIYNSGTNLYVSEQSEKGGVQKLATNKATFNYGTASTFTATASCKMVISNTNYNYTYTIAIAYDGTNGIQITASDNASLPATHKTRYTGNTYTETIGDSTKSALGNPIYIDLDIGEAWNEDYGEPVSINNAVVLGAELPKLPPGGTVITFDNTITDLKIAPRWWKV